MDPFNSFNENKQRIADNISKSYSGGEMQKDQEQDDNSNENQTPSERRELIKSQIAGSFSEESERVTDEELEKSADDFLEKGGKRAVIGEKRQFGGREYIKTANGWKFHGKGTGAKATQHREDALDHHVETGKGDGEEKEVGKVGKPDSISLDKDHKNDLKITAGMVEAIQGKNPKNEKETINAMRDFAQQAGNKYTESEYNDMYDQYIEMSKKEDKPTSKHIGDMSATDMKAAADKLGIDVKGKSVKQVRKELTDANIDKQMADFKAKKELTHDPETGRELTSLERAALKAQNEGK